MGRIDFYPDWPGNVITAGMIASEAWTGWAPTLTNITLGNGTVSAYYIKIGRTVNYRFKFIMGSTSAMGTTPMFSLPVAPNPTFTNFETVLGHGLLYDAGTAYRACQVGGSASLNAVIYSFGTTGSVVTITPTVPHTWAVGDYLSVTGTYEAAS